MKKWWITFLLLCLLVGCNQTTLTIKKEELQEIKYGELTLLKKEHDTISEYFQELKFKKGELKEKDLDLLTIVTNNERYQIHITENHHFYYEKDEKTYYSKDQSIEDFVNYLEKLKKTYLREDFYQIEEVSQYQSGNNDLLIKLDSSDHYLILTSEFTLTNFRIHKIEKEGDDYEDIDLIYQNELIEQGHRIVIRTQTAVENSMIRITFTTPYQYEVSIIPIYDRETKEITFQKEFKAKENS